MHIPFVSYCSEEEIDEEDLDLDDIDLDNITQEDIDKMLAEADKMEVGMECMN